jgi:SAM-dependent methyltransferase
MALSLSFIRDFWEFRRLATATHQSHRVPLWKDRYPCLNDKTAATDFDRHYVYHTAWAARVLARTMPEFHVDISSSLYFCGMISAFVPVKFYDYRPAELILDNLSTEGADLLSLPFENNTVGSLSCMHVVEHVGLGRYGDGLDPDGDLKAIAELRRVLACGGNLLFVVPIGKPKVMFNAHRIYSRDQIREYFSGLQLKEFALIPDNPADGGLLYNPPEDVLGKQNYGCGCFWFVKPLD